MPANGKKNTNHKRKIVKVKVKLTWKNILLYGFILLFGLFLLLGFLSNVTEQNTVSISDIVNDVHQNKVTGITIVDTKITATEKNGKELIAFKEPNSNIYQIFKDAGISLNKTKITVKDQSNVTNWINILSSVLPIVLMFAFFYFLFRQAKGAQHNIFSFLQSHPKLFN